MADPRLAYKILVRRNRRRWIDDEDRIDLWKAHCEAVNWTESTEDRVQWLAFVNTIMNLLFFFVKHNHHQVNDYHLMK
jgi:hypothetical protein